MNRKSLCLLLTAAITVAACAKKQEAPPPAAVDTQAAAPAPATETQTAPPPLALPTVTMPAGVSIPSAGMALWLIADDAKSNAARKVESWSNPAVPGVTASATKPQEEPSLVSQALNGHAVLRFDGEENRMMTTIDISPAAMPTVTVCAVFNSATADASPLRKLYGDDNGGYDRAVGLDDRGTKNYSVFASGVQGYFALEAGKTYITVDRFTKNAFSGWVNGQPAIVDMKAEWDDALPNLFIGGTGTSFHEPWKGDIAEMIVYARDLTDEERNSVVSYLAGKYGVTIEAEQKK